MSKGLKTTETAAASASAAIYNLRSALVLFIVAVHCELPYLSFLPARPYAFDKPPYLWRSFPLIDSARAMGFDIFSAWVDIFVMSLFFLVSGLFVWKSLERRGPSGFVRTRALQLGLPFALAVLILMPLAIYPVYAQGTPLPTVSAFWQKWRALPFWPAGPLWFLWLLLAADITAAALFFILASGRDIVVRTSRLANEHPREFIAGLLIASACAYIPLAVLFGPLPWFQWGPFSVQYCRPAHYAVYFFAGVVIGACGLERGLIAPDGLLARHWQRWLAAAVAGFLLWLAASAFVMTRSAAPLSWQIADDLSYVVACLTNGLAALAVAIRLSRFSMPWFENLHRNAYGIYLVHYPFVAWLQFALLQAKLSAIVKASMVFAAALTLSWSASSLSRQARDAVFFTARKRPARNSPP